MKHSQRVFKPSHRKFGFFLVLVILITLLGTITVAAQSENPEQVQKLSGRISGSDDVKNYMLTNLLQGDKLYVHVQGTSGNLDPFDKLEMSSI